jgi:plastocyanin
MARIITPLFILFIVFSMHQSLGQSLHIVEVANFAFTPADIEIAVGDTVEWQWVSGLHTTTSDSTTGQNVWDEIIDASNQTFRFVITAPGVHNYVCTPHQAQGMVGSITATPVSDVNDESNPLEDFILSQNYPNPFNPATIIKWQSTVGSHQTLKIYNLLGKEVATLVNEYRPAGIYEIEFNATELTSGIYFYKLQADNYIATRKMILLK